MDALLQRESSLSIAPLPPGVADRRLGLVGEIRAFIGRVYPNQDVGEIGSDHYELLCKSVACLDRVLVTPLAGAFVQSRAFPAACFLLASKFVKPDFLKIQDAAGLCGVCVDEMVKVELFVFFYSGLNLFCVTASDYLAALDIPGEHMLALAEKLVASLYLVPYTSHPPSVVAAALLHSALPVELLGLDADTGLSRFLRAMVGQREAVLCLAGRLK